MLSKYLQYLNVIDVTIETPRDPTFWMLQLSLIERNALMEVIRFSVSSYYHTSYKVTTKLSGFKYCSKGIALFYMSKLKDHIIEHIENDLTSDWIRTKASLMLATMQKYWQFIADEDMVVSGLLDPRKEKLPNTPTIQHHVESLEKMLENEELLVTSNVEHSDEEDLFTEPARKCKSRERTEKDEFMLYNVETLVPQSYDAVEWWKNEDSKRYPILAKRTRSVLSVQATSIPSEQLFSSAGRTINERRAFLSDSSASALVGLKSLMKFYNVEEVTQVNEPEEENDDLFDQI
ncbi:hypothetical protein P9112_013483 [Eukaryota sp. TZLM1-RC]